MELVVSSHEHAEFESFAHACARFFFSAGGGGARNDRMYMRVGETMQAWHALYFGTQLRGIAAHGEQGPGYLMFEQN